MPPTNAILRGIPIPILMAYGSCHPPNGERGSKRMDSSTVVGALLLGVPAFIVAYFALFMRRRPVFWFALALIAVGLGYLGSTGALGDIGDLVVGAAETTPEPTPVAP